MLQLPFLSVWDCRKDSLRSRVAVPYIPYRAASGAERTFRDGSFLIERPQSFDQEEETRRAGLRRVAVPSIPYPAASAGERTFRGGSF